MSLSWTLALIAAGLFLAAAIVYDSLVAEVNSISTTTRVEPFEEVEISRDFLGRRKWIDTVFVRHKELFPTSRRRAVMKLLMVAAFITAFAWRLTVKPQPRVENPYKVQALDRSGR